MDDDRRVALGMGKVEVQCGVLCRVPSKVMHELKILARAHTAMSIRLALDGSSASIVVKGRPVAYEVRMQVPPQDSTLPRRRALYRGYAGSRRWTYLGRRARSVWTVQTDRSLAFSSLDAEVAVESGDALSPNAGSNSEEHLSDSEGCVPRSRDELRSAMIHLAAVGLTEARELRRRLRCPVDTDVLQSVLSREAHTNRWVLRPELWADVNENWPEYTAQERAAVTYHFAQSRPSFSMRRAPRDAQSSFSRLESILRANPSPSAAPLASATAKAPDLSTTGNSTADHRWLLYQRIFRELVELRERADELVLRCKDSAEDLSVNGELVQQAANRFLEQWGEKMREKMFELCELEDRLAVPDAS